MSRQTARWWIPFPVMRNPVALVSIPKGRPGCFVAAVTATFFAFSAQVCAESVCFGTPGKGRLQGGVRLPASGANFSPYSSLAGPLGRTYVHSTVEKIVVMAFKALEKSAPGKVYVYAETGFESGGTFSPHRTHQNGLSVDFMVPVLDTEGRSVPLPTGPSNKFGYDIDFDKSGRFGKYLIDFDAIGEHLYQLHAAAQTEGAGITLVIFDPRYLPKLFATPRGKWLRDNLNFMKQQAWVRHDEHYHVDFRIPCKAMK